MKVSALVAALLLGSSWLFAQEDGRDRNQADRPTPSLFPEGYADHDALAAALKAAARAKPDAVKVRSLTRTLEGRDLWMATVGLDPNEGKPGARPAILVVANLEADHVVGSQVALRLVEELAGRKELLGGVTFHVVPRLNADGAERMLTARPRADFRLNLRPVDRDRDGKANEDGPDDLDGDGLLLRMRAKDDKATLVPDDKEPRLLRKADPAKGERAVYSEYAEGTDSDGDGSINEDPPGGVNLNRNWPHRWTEFDPEAGFSPASEPAVLALIRFAFDHPEIAAVWSFGLNDNLKAEPRAGGTIDAADLPYLVELSKAYNKAVAPARKAEAPKEKDPEGEKAEDEPKEPEKKAETPAEGQGPQRAATPEDRSKSAAPQAKGQGGRGGGRPGGGQAGGTPPPAAPTPASDLAPTTDGALSEWAYHQFGAVGLASRPWSTPEIPDPPAGQPAPPADGDARWLAWNDAVMGGRAFIPFRTVEHPTLGPVEVGGWRPGVRLNPPIEQVDSLVGPHLAFLEHLAGQLARLEIVEAKVEARGGRIYAIEATVINTGKLPTALAQGVRTRKAPPVLVRLGAGESRLLAGRALERVESLAASGGRRTFRWLILAPEGLESVRIEAGCPRAGTASHTLELP